MLGHGDNSERLAAFSGMVRSLIEQLEATVAALGDYDDEYEEPSLEEASADDQIIERAYTDIKDMLPVTLHGQPACPVMPRLAPIPRNSAPPAHLSVAACPLRMVLRAPPNQALVHAALDGSECETCLQL